MKITELKKRLHNVGVDVSEKTLRRWGTQGIIKDHKKPKGAWTGRGHEEKWHEKSFEEAAAFWAVRDSGIVPPRSISAKKVAEIKNAAYLLFESKDIFFESSSEFTIVTPPRLIFDAQKLKLTVNYTELNNLAVTWIAAVEKAKQIIRISERVEVILDWYYVPPYKPPSVPSSIIPLDSGTKMLQQMYEVIRKAEQTMLRDEEYKRIQIEDRLIRGEPRLKPLQSNGDDLSNRDKLTIFLYSHQEFMDAQVA
jgi:hypothetical protein